MEFVEIANVWKEARLQLAEKKVALIEATHDLKGTESDAWAQEGGIPGKNEAARKAALFIITYPGIEMVNKLKAEIVLLEVEVDYQKALMYNALRTEAEVAASEAMELQRGMK